MHSLTQKAYVRAVTTERVEAARRRAIAARVKHPPAVRAAGRIGPRLGPPASRRAVA